MTFFKKIITFIWRCWFMLLSGTLVFVFGVFFVFPLSFSQKTFPIAYQFIRYWAIISFYGSGFRYNLIVNESLDKNQNYMFISNHTSIMDIMLVLILIKDHNMVFVGKEELTKIPIFGTIYKQCAIIVDRSNKESKKDVYIKANEKIALNRSVFIYPEGGVPDDRSIILDQFKKGAFAIAINAKIPIVIYTICGLNKMFPFSWTEGYPGKVNVKLNKIVSTENLSSENLESLTQSCYDEMYDSLKQCAG